MEASTVKMIGVTACPTGIAHSEMAAESMENAAEEAGHEIKVEVRGSIGTENELTDEDIENADVLILATDISVPTDRFGDMPRIKIPVQKIITDPETVIDKAEKAAEGKDVEIEEPDEKEAEETGQPAPEGGIFRFLKDLFS